MFQALLCPSSGARDYNVDYHIGCFVLGLLYVGGKVRLGRSIALLFHDCGTRRGWVVSSTPWPHFTPWKDPVPILQDAGWAPGPVWTGGKSRPHQDLIPDRPARSQSIYRLSYPAHNGGIYSLQKHYKFISYCLTDCLSRLHLVRAS